MPAVSRERLTGQKMHRHRIRRESVDDKNVGGGGRSALERQSGIANDDRRVGLATRQEGELGGIAGDPDNHRIDLVERPMLPGPGIAGERAGPEADDTDARCIAVQAGAAVRAIPTPDAGA